ETDKDLAAAIFWCSICSFYFFGCCVTPFVIYSSSHVLHTIHRRRLVVDGDLNTDER
ncbi:unnamed protein product, partial [Musa textilis]